MTDSLDRFEEKHMMGNGKQTLTLMYWAYLGLLIVGVLTPLLVTHEYSVLPEEELESLVVLLIGMLAFFLYFVKEKELFSLFKERITLQKTTHNIQRDLSESYTYIGSVNRKQEIIKELLFDLSVRTARDSEYCLLWYRKILQAALELARVEAASLRLVDVRQALLLDHHEEGNCDNDRYVKLTPDVLLGQGKSFFEYDGHFVIRSPRASDGVAAFLVIPKKVNHLEDIEIFRMLTASALLLYSLSYADRH